MAELNSIQILLPEEFEEIIKSLIAKVQNELKIPEIQLWDFEWVTDRKE